ncbi:SAM-dependent methyltransferase [Olsenella sp. An290]|nr:SAM-dependent methyltransferase [Olsenella sp. An290]
MLAASAAGLELRRDDGGLALVGDGMVLRADLARLLPRLRPDRLGRELLVRAARVRGVPAPTAVDATAGLGEDALLLAAAGFTVTLFEKDPVIAALLRDALERAAGEPQLAGIVSRMELVEGDSVAGLHALGLRDHAPDVVFLDPMFPERTKSAAVKKKFQLLHHLERPCEDEARLLDAARAARPRKIVVKRPPKGPWLAGAKPSHSLAGKAVRYDVLVPPPSSR